MTSATVGGALLLVISAFLLQPLWAAAALGPVPAYHDDGSKDNDFIDELPNQPESGAEFRQYGGYIPVQNPVGSKRYYYYFVEAAGDDDPTTKPLILYVGCHGGSWKCSSVLSAFLQVGPFRVESDGETLDPNPYSWNQFANIIFVESPVGAGFSLPEITLDALSATDDMVVGELYEFMLRWLQRFPNYKNTDFYIAGQEYIGVLAPALANLIVERNKSLRRTVINVRGILMGNPTLDQSIETYLRMEYGYSNNFVPEGTLESYRRDCSNVSSSISNADAMKCMASHGVVSDLKYTMDPNSIYGKICPEIDLDAVDMDSFKTVVYDCEIQNVAGYLNIPFVQRVMHVENPQGGPAIWTPYASEAEWRRGILSSEAAIKALLANNVRVLIYGGVLDHEEPVLSCATFISNLNLTVLSGWRPWFDSAIQVAGFTETYREGLTFATVRNAGRKVSKDQPKRGYVLAKSFLENGHLPSSAYF